MKELLDRVTACYRQGLHCSEAMVIGVGGLYMQPVPAVLVRASCPFGGGVCDHQELCGVLSGGVMVLGALWGRSEAGVNDDCVNELACIYRQRFITRFGYAKCEPIHDSDWRSEDDGCARVVRAGAEILIALIEEAYREMPFVGERRCP